MSSSGEDSPDWLHSYKTPNHSFVTLSSDSNSSHRIQLPSKEDLPVPQKTIHIEFSLSPEEGKYESNKIHHDEAQSSIKNIFMFPMKIEASDSLVCTKKRKANQKNKEEAQTLKKEIAQQHVDSHPTHDLATTLSSDSESLMPKSPTTENPVSEDSSLSMTTKQESGFLPVSRSDGSVPKDVSHQVSTEKPPMKRLKTVKKSKDEENKIGEDPIVDIPKEEVEMHTEPHVRTKSTYISVTLY